MRPRSATVMGGRPKSTFNPDTNAGALSKTMKERDQLLVRIRNLQDELQLALMAAEDIRALKEKLKVSCTHLDNEKKAHLRTESAVISLKETKMCYADHLEHLIGSMKLMGKSKMKAVETARCLRVELKKQVFENKRLERKNKAKDKLIKGLRETNHVLNNQLRLMDEQMNHVRKNVDGVRNEQRTTVARAAREAKTLRETFAAATGRSLDEEQQRLNRRGLHSPGGCGGGDDVPTSPFFDQFVDNNGPQFSPSPGKVRPKSAGATKLRKGGRGATAPGKIELQNSVVSMSNQQKDTAMEIIVEKLGEKQRKKHGANKSWTEDSIRDLATARDPPRSPSSKKQTKEQQHQRQSRPQTAKH